MKKEQLYIVHIALKILDILFPSNLYIYAFYMASFHKWNNNIPKIINPAFFTNTVTSFPFYDNFCLNHFKGMHKIISIGLIIVYSFTCLLLDIYAVSNFLYSKWQKDEHLIAFSILRLFFLGKISRIGITELEVMYHFISHYYWIAFLRVMPIHFHPSSVSP